MQKGQKMVRVGSHTWDNRVGVYVPVYEENVDYAPDVRGNFKLFKRSFYNRDYPNVILIYWKSGAGGLFLANCLSLSNRVISTFETQEEKIEFLEKYIDDQNLFWNDCYLNNITAEIQFDEKWHKNRYFMVYDHDPNNIPNHLKFWSNLNVIYFKNPDLFVKMRRVLKNFGGNIIHTSYEEVLPTCALYPIPRTFEEYYSLSVEEKKNIHNFYKSNEDFGSQCYLNNKKLFYVWDTNWYFSKKLTLKYVKHLYQCYQFDDYNEEYISRYYDKWFSKIREIKRKPIPRNIYEICKNEELFDRTIMYPEDLNS